jgi:hypothetical protein
VDDDEVLLAEVEGADLGVLPEDRPLHDEAAGGGRIWDASEDLVFDVLQGSVRIDVHLDDLPGKQTEPNRDHQWECHFSQLGRDEA